MESSRPATDLRTQGMAVVECPEFSVKLIYSRLSPKEAGNLEMPMCSYNKKKPRKKPAVFSQSNMEGAV